MRPILREELKQRQIEILDAVASFCEENEISYWIDCGTLLGAIRHKGYIPWDDDIDIGMLRPDFERFAKLFNQSNERFCFSSIDYDENFLYSHGKVMDRETVLYEPDRNGIKLAINVDIFVYDNTPDSDADMKKQYDKRDQYRKLHNLRVFKTKPNGNLIRRVAVRFTRLLVKPFPKNYFMKKMSANAKRYVDLPTKRVGNFTSFTRMHCDRSAFDSFTYAEFEGKSYRIPVGYDAWLKAFYGDYMKLPPEEKRVSHHMFEAYLLEEEKIEAGV